MRVFLTGSSGCLARVLLPALCAEEAVTQVTGIDLADPVFSHPKFVPVALDMRSPDLRARMAGHDAVVHLAFAVKRGRLSLGEMADINVGGSRNVIEAAHANGVRRFVNLSSVSVYGAGEDMAEDRAPAPPDWFPNAQHKAEVERCLAERIPSAAQLRAHLIIGTHAQAFLREIFLLPVWLDFGERTPRQQVVHESDVADAVLAALRTGASGIYNLAAADILALGGDYLRKGREEGRRIRRMPFSVVRAGALFARAMVRSDALTLISMLNTTATVSCEKAGRELGWRPQRSAWQARLDALGSLRDR